MEGHKTLPPSFWKEGGVMWKVGSPHVVCGVGPFSFQSQPIVEGFYRNNFFLDDPTPWVVPQQVYSLAYDDFMKALPPVHPPFATFQEPDWKLYLTQYQDLFSLLERGSLHKGVPYTRKEKEGGLLSLLGSLPPLFYGRYKEKTPEKNKEEGFSLEHVVGYWSQSREEGFVGATPELLFERKGSTVHTVALAGTYPSTQKWEELNPALQLKLEEEHRYVVEDLKNRFSTKGQLHWGIRQTQFQLGKRLHHLLTPLEVQLNNPQYLFEDLVHTIHPTAALGIYPQNPEGRAWLRTCQSVLPRHMYGGIWGWISNTGHQQACALIRCTFWEKEKLFLYAGGGVTKESKVEEEQAELELKFRAIEGR